MSPDISIVIPSYKGLHLLRENLPSVRAAAARYCSDSGSRVEIVVVDDGSADETLERLPREFPEVRLLARSRNGGFAAACNTGFTECAFDLVALLNNDVRLNEQYLNYKARHFADPAVFAVTAKIFEPARPIFSTGGRFGSFRRGFWSVYFNYDVAVPTAAEWIDRRRLLSFYAIGGFATYSRAKLMELGGFNELLSPFHWEDVDLSYRAWKRGWEVHYEPRSIAYHQASSTIDAHFEKESVDAVSFRNRLLFHWINLHTRSWLAKHVAMLLLMFMTRFLVLDHRFYRSLFQALGQLREVQRLRRREKARSRRSDAELGRLLKRFYAEAPIQIYYNRKEVMLTHPDSQGDR